MDLRNYAYFVAVYEERNLSRAAQRCLVSQPSISMAMQQFEDTMGAQLFIRHSKGVTPTPAGDLLYPRAVRLIEDARAVQNLLRTHTPARALRIALMPLLPSERTGLLLREIAGAAPDLDLMMVEGNEPADLRIVSQTLVRDSEIFAPLWHDEFALAVPAAHALAMRPIIRVEDLAAQPMLVRIGCEVQRHLDELLRAAGLAVTVKGRVRGDEEAMAFVDAGLGACLVPATTRTRPNVTICALSGAMLERNIGVTHDRGYAMPDPIAQAVDYCRRRWQSG